MPMHPFHVQERLSLAYIQAVAAAAGVAFNSTLQTDYGVDGWFQRIVTLSNGINSQTGIPISCQVKATTSWIEEPQFIVYDLNADAYNKLVTYGAPTILILFRMPTNQSEWLVCTEKVLELRSCCYWAVINGQPTDNTSSKRIRIDRRQLFDPPTIVDLLERVRQTKGTLYNAPSVLS